MGSVTNSGTAEITNQLEYDEVAYEANRKIYDLSRDMMKDLGVLPLVLRIRMILIWQEKNIGIFMKIVSSFA